MIVLWTAPQGGMRGLGLERAAASEAHCLGGLQQADHTGRLPSRAGRLVGWSRGGGFPIFSGGAPARMQVHGHMGLFWQSGLRDNPGDGTADGPVKRKGF